MYTIQKQKQTRIQTTTKKFKCNSKPTQLYKYIHMYIWKTQTDIFMQKMHNNKLSDFHQ